jgi:hypothetical protein
VACTGTASGLLIHHPRGAPKAWTCGTAAARAAPARAFGQALAIVLFVMRAELREGQQRREASTYLGNFAMGIGFGAKCGKVAALRVLAQKQEHFLLSPKLVGQREFVLEQRDVLRAMGFLQLP